MLLNSEDKRLLGVASSILILISLYKSVSIDKLISLQEVQRAEQDDTDGQALVLEERLAYARQVLLNAMAIIDHCMLLFWCSWIRLSH